LCVVFCPNMAHGVALMVNLVLDPDPCTTQYRVGTCNAYSVHVTPFQGVVSRVCRTNVGRLSVHVERVEEAKESTSTLGSSWSWGLTRVETRADDHDDGMLGCTTARRRRCSRHRCPRVSRARSQLCSRTCSSRLRSRSKSSSANSVQILI